MDNVPTKNTGDSYTADEFNPSNDELKNAVTQSAQSLDGDTSQISRAMAVNAAGATFYTDTGAADAYVLGLHGLTSLKAPTAYFQGMLIRFRPGNNNTGSSTANVAALGSKAILKADGVTALSGGEMLTTEDVFARFDITADGGLGAFFLGGVAPEATQTGKGTVFLGDQRITLANNGADPSSDIDFSGGRFNFDDGTGQSLVLALTKQLDIVFTAGPAQGGLDVLPKAPDTTYHCFAVNNPSTGVNDYAFTVNAAGPTLVGNLVGFTKQRRVGSITTDAVPDIIGFIQIAKYFYLKTELLSFTGELLIDSTTPVTVTLDVPVGIQVLALINVFLNITSNSTATVSVRFFNDAFDNVVVTDYNSQATTDRDSADNNIPTTTPFEILTNTSAEVSSRNDVDIATSADEVGTRGWIDLTLEDT